jgi:hypothetical protein
LLGADTFPEVSTALTTIVFVAPSARQYVIVESRPITQLSAANSPFT